MENLLGNIYDWFQSFYGQSLSYYLWGYVPTTGQFDNPNIYNLVGLITLGVTLFIVVFFYYIYDHPRYCKWWSWLITMGINGAIALFIAFGIVRYKFLNGFIPEGLVKQLDADGNIISILIDMLAVWGFGVANIFVSTIAFVIFSFMLKWGSTNSKHVPFL